MGALSRYNKEQLLQQLEGELKWETFPLENDLAHSRRLIKLAAGIHERRKNFDLHEFRAAALLHEIDRSTSLRQNLIILGGPHVELNGRTPLLHEEELKKEAHREGVKVYARKQLIPFRPPIFEEGAIERIVDAVAQHSKRFNEPGDSGLLAALRLADKLDRMGPYGLVTAVIHRCPALPVFDPQFPFGYKSTIEGKLNSAYNDWMRVFEWYNDDYMTDDDRTFVDEEQFRARITIVREITEDYAMRNGIENGVEEDLKAALGRHYKKFVQ